MTKRTFIQVDAEATSSFMTRVSWRKEAAKKLLIDHDLAHNLACHTTLPRVAAIRTHIQLSLELSLASSSARPRLALSVHLAAPVYINS